MPFHGSDYDPKHDLKRLKRQIDRIKTLMSDQKYRTLKQIETATGDPQASISAQLRNLRKTAGGSHIVNRRPIDRDKGLWEYQLLPPEKKGGDLFGDTKISVI